jgi:hypothetical protein
VDISSVFLNGDLEEEIYMKQPEGFQEMGPGYVCKLSKSLYGLKQAARQWNKKLHTTLLDMGFRRLDSDSSIYIYIKDGVRIIIPIFIDDITLASSSQSALDRVVAELASHFKLRDLGPTSFLLGIEIIRDRAARSIALSQQQYIIDMLQRYGFESCNPLSTPMDPKLNLQKAGELSESEKVQMEGIPYLSAIGALNYLALQTRPDICYAVGKLARFSANPSPIHWNAVKHVFRYLQGTKHYKLVYKPDGSEEMFTTYSDADLSGCKDSGHSTGGYIVKMGTGVISWSSKLQTIIAQSTTEAEYIAAAEAGKEIMWMRNILGEFGYTLSSPSTLYIDNQSAINVAKNPEHHGRMKHLDLRTHWLRHNVEDKIFRPVHVSTGEMLADCMTKALPRVKHDYCRQNMGLE